MGSSELRKAFVIFPKAILLNPAYQRVIWQTQKGVPVYKAVLNAAARIPLQMVVDTHHEFTEPDLEKYTGNVSRLDADLERLKNVKPALLLSPEAKQL